MRKLILISLSAFLFILPAHLSAQQTRTSEEERLLQKERLQELEALLILPKVEKKKKIAFNLGGWLSTTFRYYENTDNDISVSESLKASWLQDIRLWATWVILQRHLVYLRFKDFYIQRATGDGYTGIGDDHDGPHLDSGYLNLSFGKFIPWELSLGRQYIYIGRGISYSAIHDGLKLIALPLPFFIKAFYSQALNHEEDIDSSIPRYDKESERIFSGIELSWLGIKDNILYTYFLLQHHLLDEALTDSSQSYNYDSQYIGLGLEGKKKNISYWLELIKEYGKSFTDSGYVPLEKKNIDAWALDMGVRKDFDVKFSPSIELEYAFGSGDDDRTSVTDTSGGNRFGNDENFLYFGDFFSGYALNTRLSNIHIYKIQGALNPLPKLKRFNLHQMNIGAKYFMYRKDQTGGGTYDTESTQDNADIGQELDLFLYWRPTENSNAVIRYGIFYPGKAYPETTDTPTKYLYLRFTLYF